MKAFYTLITLGAALVGWAQKYPEPVYVVDGVAIKGYDPVAYFTAGSATKGSPAFQLKWGGAIWYFATQENQRKFEGSPEKYAPQYGGYCAYGMGNGYKAKVDPENSWTIYKGKLFLNYNPSVKKDWLKDQEQWIEKADRNWPKVK